MSTRARIAAFSPGTLQRPGPRHSRSPVGDCGSPASSPTSRVGPSARSGTSTPRPARTTLLHRRLRRDHRPSRVVRSPTCCRSRPTRRTASSSRSATSARSNGVNRHQIVKFGISGPSYALTNWYTTLFESGCSPISRPTWPTCSTPRTAVLRRAHGRGLRRRRAAAPAAPRLRRRRPVRAAGTGTNIRPDLDGLHRRRFDLVGGGDRQRRVRRVATSAGRTTQPRVTPSAREQCRAKGLRRSTPSTGCRTRGTRPGPAGSASRT